jgi:hypothetical protein
MADLSVIKEYLVRLGFDVKSQELAKFNDALRSATQQVEKISVGMAKTFVAAGGAVLTTLTAIATGTVALADHVSASDLSLQVWARRMYLSTDAARALKNATDALGYSLEDIIWGPKELQERFGVLMGDQKQMQAGLGADFETQMRRMRDVRFEFTRLGETLQYLGMNIVASLGRRLFGEEGGIADFLKGFIETIIPKLPEIGDRIAKFLVPVIKDVASIFHDIFNIVTMLLPSLDKMAKTLDSVADGAKMISKDVKSVFDYVVPKAKTGIDAIDNGISKAAIRQSIVDAATAAGLDPAIALAIAQRESGFDPNAKSNKGAIGLFQLMPDTAKGLGVDPNDPNQNIRGGISYLLQLYAKYHDWYKTFEAYNGGLGNVDRGTVSRDARTYAEDMMKESNRNRVAMGNFNPISYSGGTSVGDITIHINQPNATPDQIHKAVVKAIDDKAAKQTQRNIAQLGGAMA